MPYPNEHACRLKDPSGFDKFNRENCAQKHNDKCIDVIYGIKEGKSAIQALRYPKDTWTASAAKSHCESRDGAFEAAGKASNESHIEVRSFPLSEFRIIRNDEGKIEKLVGHAAVFDKLSLDLGGFREKIAPGAFKKSIKGDDIRALFNHDRNYVLGRTRSKTLTLKEDDQGLYTEITPPDTTWAKDLMKSVDRGDITQMSFGFETIADSWEKKEKEDIRTLEEAKLFDVSPVTFPAYPDTDVSVALRSQGEWREASGETAGDDNQNDDGETAKQEELDKNRRERESEIKGKQIKLKKYQSED